MTLTFWGHVILSVTWPLYSQYVVSYRWSIWTDRLSRTVVEILSLKDFGVTTLTFWVHVTSSVAWPLDWQLGFIYVVLSLSRMIAEILRVKQPSIFPSKMHWSPFFVLGAKVGVTTFYNCVHITATVGPRALLLRYTCSDLPSENALQGWKTGTKVTKQG